MNHFTFNEFVTRCTVFERSTFPLSFVTNVIRLSYVLELVRLELSKYSHQETPIIINSCYRDSMHNKRVGGVSTSQHLTASAVDFTIRDISRISSLYTIVLALPKSSFHQLIIYDTFVHFGLSTGVQDGQVLDKRSDKSLPLSSFSLSENIFEKYGTSSNL